MATPVRTPVANSICERVIGTMRRECLDFMIPLNERHLYCILQEWINHYNLGRPHMSLGPGIPQPPASLPELRPVHRHGLAANQRVRARPVLETPAEEPVCDDLNGALYGLCVACCEAMDCHLGDPFASDRACERVLTNYMTHSDGDLPPAMARSRAMRTRVKARRVRRAKAVRKGNPKRRRSWRIKKAAMSERNRRAACMKRRRHGV